MCRFVTRVMEHLTHDLTDDTLLLRASYGAQIEIYAMPYLSMNLCSVCEIVSNAAGLQVHRVFNLQVTLRHAGSPSTAGREASGAGRCGRGVDVLRKVLGARPLARLQRLRKLRHL